MSDFVHGGWSWYVAIATVVSLLACLVLLIFASRRKQMAADESTGHVWDENIREMNNPLPMWWVVLFVLTVVFSLVYLALYPGLGSSPGRLEWSSSGQWKEEKQRLAEEMAPVYARFGAMSHEAIAADSAARGIGERLFLNHCAGCHGSDARGSKGFPNLADSDWLYGGGIEQITQTIVNGRTGAMPPMAAAVGSGEDVRNLAHHVLSLSGSPHDSIRAAQGRSKFSVCAACHGVRGEGNAALGAPNLTDNVWLYGWGEQAVVQAITQGRAGMMPAQAERLTPEQIRVLSAYVWGLSKR
jgi:cytochrome c oxidase cbb3-type subunit III